MNKWLDGLPTTNFKAVCIVLITFLTMLGMGLLIWVSKPIDSSVLAMWLTFVGGLWGINFAQFWAKRRTQFKPPEKKDEAGT